MASEVRNQLNPDTEIWQDEGFDSYEEYEDYYVRLVDDKYEEARQYWKPKKDRWNSPAKRLELEASGLGIFKEPTRTDIPLLPQAVEEAIALLCESVPRPQASSRQAPEDDMASALNYFMAEEMDANGFDILMARVAYDMKRFGVGCIKQTIELDCYGPFYNPGRIVFTKVDPRHVWPDPFAKSWLWNDMRYLCIAEPMDLTDIRTRFPLRGAVIEPEATYSLNRTDGDGDGGTGFTWVSPGQPNNNRDVIGERHRALVKELWLKDDRRVFEPDLDDDGNPIYDSYGDPVGKSVKRYEYGRLIVVANGRLLLDVANPFRHHQPPYTFFPARITAEVFSWGEVELLARIEDKINLLAKDAIKNLRANMNSPWLADAHAFDSPEKFKNLTNEEGLVIIKRPGAVVQRHPPAELPASLAPFMGWLREQFDDILGIQGVMRGQLAEGAQLAAETVQNLQGASTSRIRLKSRLLEKALEHFGYLLQWNIRQTYPTQMQVQINDPSSGEQKQLNWNDDEAQDDYAISIETGSSVPGAKQGAASQAILMWDHDLIDREATLGMMQLPGAGAIIKRMNDRTTQLAQLGAEAELRKNKTGSAGRKHSSIDL